MWELGETLRRARKSKNLTQQRVAERLHIDRSTYAKYESGRVMPPLDRMRGLAQLLELSPAVLLGLPQPNGCDKE